MLLRRRRRRRRLLLGRAELVNKLDEVGIVDRTIHVLELVNVHVDAVQVDRVQSAERSCARLPDSAAGKQQTFNESLQSC